MRVSGWGAQIEVSGWEEDVVLTIHATSGGPLCGFPKCVALKHTSLPLLSARGRDCQAHTYPLSPLPVSPCHRHPTGWGGGEDSHHKSKSKVR